MEYFLLENRKVISIQGEDKKKFLQGIITNDVNKINPESYLYALMLTPQGKLLYDFFILEKDGNYLLDCPLPYIPDIIKKFNIYKLRSDVNIVDQSNKYNVYSSFDKMNDLFIPDPRNKSLGYRAISEKSVSFIEPPKNCVEYELLRTNLLVPDMVNDLEPGRYFPLELQLDKLNAVDYQKGCYVGQEVTARTHYRGVVRKAVYKIEIISGENLHPGIEIFFGEKKIGQTLGCTESLGLSLMRNENIEEIKDQILLAGKTKVKLAL